MTNLNKIKNYYNFYLKKHKKGSKAVNWGSKKSHQIRFCKILEASNFNNKKIHDVGCGLAHLYTFLKNKKIKFKYLGSDISGEMIESARNQLVNKKINLQKLNLLKINQNPAVWCPSRSLNQKPRCEQSFARTIGFHDPDMETPTLNFRKRNKIPAW